MCESKNYWRCKQKVIKQNNGDGGITGPAPLEYNLALSCKDKLLKPHDLTAISLPDRGRSW